MKILEAAAGYPNAYLRRKFEYILKNSASMTYNKIIGTEHAYEITNDNGCTYVVDTQVGLCSCPSGIVGEFCKHQFYLSHYVNASTMNEIPDNTEDNLSLHYIITGNDEISSDLPISSWFNTDIAFLNTKFSQNTDFASEDDSSTFEHLDDDNSKLVEENIANSSMQVDHQLFESTLAEFKNVFQDIIAKSTNDSFFLPGLQSFINSYETTRNNDAALFSSLHSFGKLCTLSTTNELSDLAENAANSIAGFNIPDDEIIKNEN